jgi:hypothetical protein
MTIVRPCWKIYAAAALLFGVIIPGRAPAQSIRFSNHREIRTPDYATLMVGSFYSDWSFAQEAGVMHTRSRGTGADFLFGNERGAILKDGLEYPLISTFDMKNYLSLTRSADLDFSVSVSYAFYPMETQEDRFDFDLAEEGVLGTLSTEIDLTPFVKATLSDSARYKTDYIDTRGISDQYGGRLYEYFNNRAGLDLDWLMAGDMNMAVTLSRDDNIPVTDGFEDQELVSWGESVMFEHLVDPIFKYGFKAGFGRTDYAVESRPGSSFQEYSGLGQVKLTRRTVGEFSAGYSLWSFASGIEAAGDGESEGMVVGTLSLLTKFSDNLNQILRADRGRRGGYSSPYEAHNTARYELEWKGVSGSARIYSALSGVEPGGDAEAIEYSDWSSGVDFIIPLIHGIALEASSEYNARKNKAEAGDDADEPEQADDYSTWINRVGTVVAIIRAPAGERGGSLDFTFYVQHIERISDSAELEYQRDIIAGAFRYGFDF